MSKDDIQIVPLKSIRPYERNAKRHSNAQVAQISESIKRFGFTVPILIDRDNVVIAGHGRALAAKRLGLDRVPVIKKDAWTEEEVKAYRLVDNNVSSNVYDSSIISSEIDFLSGFDMSLFGFNSDLQDMFPTEKRKTKSYEHKHFLVTFPIKSDNVDKFRAFLDKKGFVYDESVN